MGRIIEAAVICTDAAGRITRWSVAAEQLFGWSADEAIGQSVTLIVPAGYAREDDELRSRALGGETVATDTIRSHRIRPPISVWLTITRLTGDDRQAGGLLLTATERKGLEEPEAAARRLAAIVESSDDAIISKDLNGIVVTWNSAAERIFGYSAEEMIGRSIRVIIPEDRQTEEDATLATIRRGDKVEHFETIRRRKTGELIPISLRVSPIRTEDGRIVGASKIARDITASKQAEAERYRLLEEAAAVTEALNEVGGVVASDLDQSTVVQAVTDAATELTTAAFGAFFYNVLNEAGESYTLYTISGVPREAFSKFPMPRNTDVFEPTFKGTGVLRSDDITKDPRYGRNAPYHGMPAGHLPVHSYLAVPVKARSGEVIGGLFFGHPDVGRFTAQHERLAVGIASWASVALENARLYRNVQEANRIKDDFLATLSHELRTPLNAILGYARILRLGMVGPEKREQALEAIERNANSLAQIVEDVLDVSRIISGKIRLNVKPVDFPQVVQTAIDAVTPAAEARGVAITFALDPEASPVSGDPERLQQIVWNLASNAVKFTNRGGRVRVRLSRRGAAVELTVSDTGIGIDAEFLPHIFERFRQADSSTTRERGGLGLGLAIVQQLVEMHGGTIEATSAGEGRGATFTLTLPVAVPRADDASEPIAASVPTFVFPDLSRMHVLIVDDDRDALALVSEVLEATGAHVTSAPSAVIALTRLEAEQPDVIVADLGMPQMDGYELISRVRQHVDPRVRQVPAIALTAYARPEDRARALGSGFQIHLTKPIDPALLMSTIASLARDETKRNGRRH